MQHILKNCLLLKVVCMSIKPLDNIKQFDILSFITNFQLFFSVVYLSKLVLLIIL